MLDGGRWFNATLRPLYPQEWPGKHCIWGCVGPRAGMDGWGKCLPTRIRSLDTSTHSESLYRIRYPGAQAYWELRNMSTGWNMTVALETLEDKLHISLGKTASSAVNLIGPLIVTCSNSAFYRSQWPRGVRRGSAAARLLGLCVRILLRAWMSVLCVVRWRSLRRADHTSRGVLPTVMRRCMWSRNFKNEEARVRSSTGKKKRKEKNKFYFLFA